MKRQSILLELKTDISKLFEKYLNNDEAKGEESKTVIISLVEQWDNIEVNLKCFISKFNLKIMLLKR